MVLLQVDRASSEVGFGFGGDAAAARSVLATVAGGVIGMTSLTLSLTIVTLQLASSQFTPRALKNLLSDRINQVVAGCLKTADRLYPEPVGGSVEAAGSARPSGQPGEVTPSRPGYVEDIVLDRLTSALQGRAERIEVLLAPGDFATPAQPAVLVWPCSALGEDERKVVRRAVTVSTERDLRNDIGFGIRQLADIALRAVSQGINDPTTAVTCIGYIAAILERLATRDLPGPERMAADSGVQLHTRVVPFEFHLETGFLEIARSSDDPRVQEALIEGLRRVTVAAGAGAARDRQRAALDLAQRIADSAVDSAPPTRATDRFQQVLDPLSSPGSRLHPDRLR